MSTTILNPELPETPHPIEPQDVPDGPVDPGVQPDPYPVTDTPLEPDTEPYPVSDPIAPFPEPLPDGV